MHALRLVKVNFFMFNDFNTSLSFRLSVFKSFIRSSWEYGFQICNFSKSGIRCLESLQHYFLTKLLSISIYTNKNTIRSYLNIEDVYFRLRALQLRFFRKSYIYNRFNRMSLYNFSDLLCSYIGFGNYDIALKQSTMYGIYKKINQVINLDVRSTEFLKKLKGIRYEHMKEIYNDIRNPFVPDPSSNFHDKVYKYMPVLDNKSHRLIRLMVLKKFPGVEVECKFCKELTRSFFNHFDECNILSPFTKMKFHQLRTLKSQDWKEISNKEELKRLTIELFLLFKCE